MPVNCFMPTYPRYRRYLISFVCLAAIGALLIVLLRPWDSVSSLHWPNSKLDTISSLEFSGGQNFILQYENDRWYVKEGGYQSLADQRRVEFLLEQIDKAKVFTELPETAYNLEIDTGNENNGLEFSQENPWPNASSDFSQETGQEAQQKAGSGQNSFGPGTTSTTPAMPDVLSVPNPDEFLYDASILPTSVTLRGDNTWTIAPQIFVPEAGLISTKLIKNGRSQIVYIETPLTRLLSRPARYYADMNLFSARPERVVRIELTSPGSEVWELAKLSEGTFTFLQPERFNGIEVPQAGMEFYLHAILSTQSPSPLFIEFPEQLEEPFLQVKTVQEMPNISTGTEKEEEILTISKEKGTGDLVGYSSYQDAYFQISAEKVEQLGRSLLSLRSRPVLPNGIGSVNSASLTVWDNQGNRQVREFNRTNGAWSELDSAVSLIGVDTVFWRLSTLQTEGKGDGSHPADLIPVIRWQFEYADNKPALSLAFYTSPEETKYHWVRLNDEGPYYPVHYGAINEILGLLPAPPAGTNGH